jgi:type IV secretion system protein VirB5
LSDHPVADIVPSSTAAARAGFVEMYAAPTVLVRHLQLAVLGLTLLCVGLFGVMVHTQNQAAHVKPLVIRINDVGRAEALSYDATAFVPKAPELRYFLTRFIVLHFSRQRATIQRDYPSSLFFLSPALADATIASNEQSRVIERFLQNPSADDHEVTVKNVTLTETRTPPFKATVDFQQLAYPQGSRTPRGTETFVAQIEFAFRDEVPNQYITVNPLGLQVLNLHVDQAF